MLSDNIIFNIVGYIIFYLFPIAILTIFLYETFYKKKNNEFLNADKEYKIIKNNLKWKKYMPEHIKKLNKEAEKEWKV